MEILWENNAEHRLLLWKSSYRDDIVDTSLDGRRKEMRRGEKVPHI
jgi:hypothetical protein